jgi:glycosyltransferase involved in cell wall biosynthesis
MAGGPLSVLHVHSGNLFGGVERILETLAAHHSPDGPMASTFALCFRGRLSATLDAAGAAVHDLGQVQARRPDQIWRARRALRALMTRQRFDVALVHSSWTQAIFGPTIRRVRVPLVRWFHGPDPGPAWVEGWAARSRPALAIYNSQYTRGRAQARLPGVPAAVHYPLTACPPPASGDGRREVRSRLGTPDSAVVVVMASRIEPLKGHALLLEALGRMRAGGWQVWIVGGAQRREEFEYLGALTAAAEGAGLADRVRFLGERTDVPSLLAAADIYCQPNLGAEGFGLSFVEALAAGLPVVTTRIGAAPEVVSPDCGVLVEPGAAGDLAAALASLIADAPERRRLGESGRRRAAAFCDLPAAIAALAGTLRTLSPSPVPLT